VTNHKNLVRIGAVGLAGAILAVGASSCTIAPQPDEIKLHYHGGPLEGNSFDKVVLPGTSAGNWNVADTTIGLPTSLRTWNIAPGSEDQEAPIVAPAKDNVPVAVFLQVNMLLNTNVEDQEGFPGGTLREFWEVIGRRYGADTEDGWLRMMKVTVVPALTKAVTDTVRAYDSDPLVYNTNGIYTEVQTTIGQRFQAELERLSGGDFFCGTSFVPDWREGDGACPQVELILTNVDFANANIQAARDGRAIAEEEAAAALIEAQGHTAAQDELNAALNDPAYLEYLIAQMQLQAAQACAQGANCTVIVGDGASPVVPTR
jgi:hypothetical protein